MLNTKHEDIDQTHTHTYTHIDFSPFFFSPGNGIVGCDPEEVVANSGRRLLRGFLRWSKMVKMAGSLKNLEVKWRSCLLSLVSKMNMEENALQEASEGS